MDLRHPVTSWRRINLFACLLLLSGCASLNPDRELEIAATTANRVDSNIEPALLWDLPVQAESPAWNGIEPLTYGNAVAVAIQCDPTLRAALSMIVEKRAMFVQQGLPPNPSIAFGIGVAIDGLSGAPALVRGMQALSWLWKNPYRVESAEAELRAAVYLAAARCVDLSARTRTGLASILARQKTLSFDEQYVSITEKTVELVRSMQEAGELAQLDLDRALVDHEEAVASMVASRFKLRQVKLELLGTMGRPTASTDWQAVGLLTPDWQIPESELDLLDLAANGRLDVAASLEEVNRIEGELGLARTKRFPEVGFSLNYQQNFDNTREVLVPGMDLTLPILDNGEPAIAIQNARLDQARMKLLAAAELAQLEVRTSYNMLNEAQARIIIIRDGQLDAAIMAQERSEAAYTEGEADLNTLLMTQRKRIAVERLLVEQEYQATEAMCRLRQAVGGSFNPADNTVPEFDVEAKSQCSEGKTSL
ncbi:MAG: hypothetical protein CMJ39_04660 [Phycisphaerae bacterium]|nr:hypothetical protein [Phycisphaerae bacterium]